MPQIGTTVGGLSGSVDISSVLDSVDDNGGLRFEDLVDDAVVAASRRAKTLEFAYERFAEPLGVFGDRAEDGLQCGASHLVGESVQMTQTLGSDLDLVHEVASDVIAETQPLTF